MELKNILKISKLSKGTTLLFQQRVLFDGPDGSAFIVDNPTAARHN